MKKQSMPSHSKILDFWCSNEGTETLKKYNIKPYGIHTLTIDAGEECWCCDIFCCEGYYKGWAKDKKNNKWHGDSRERCHIIAKSMGGSYECNNLFLMCSECHRRAPNTNDPNIFFEWVVKTNEKVIRYRKDLSLGLCEIVKELFRPTFTSTGRALEAVDLKSDEYKKWVVDICKFNSEFHSDDFSNYCHDKMSFHGFGGRYHPDVLSSELGLYKQYCIKNKSILFPNL